MTIPAEKFRGLVPPAVLCVAAGAHRFSTPRDLVNLYFYRRLRFCDRLVLAMAAKAGAPCGWSWERHIADKRARFWSGNYSFRTPPLPWERIVTVGHCVLCRGPVYKLGWHRQWGDSDGLNRKANWHAACVSAFNRWSKPSEGTSGWEADHFIPLYQVYRALGRDGRWPDILWYWSHRNIRFLSIADHRCKSAREAAERARFRTMPVDPATLLFADEA